MIIEFFTVSLSTDEDGTRVIITEVNEDFKPYIKDEEKLSKKIGACVAEIIKNELEIKAEEK